MAKINKNLTPLKIGGKIKTNVYFCPNIKKSSK